MTIREIITIPDPRLKVKAKKVDEFDKELHQLIDDMVETMRVAPGVGLAATQLGIPQQIFIAEYHNELKKDSEPKLYVFVNPEIIKKSKKMVMGVEGCLSVPNFVGDVERHEIVKVKAQNRHGRKFKISAFGWLARIFQHEIDHLNGIVFADIAENLYDINELSDEEKEDIV